MQPRMVLVPAPSALRCLALRDAGFGEARHAGVAVERRAQDVDRQAGARAFAEAHAEIEQRRHAQRLKQAAMAGFGRDMGGDGVVEPARLAGVASGAAAAVQTKPSSRTGMPAGGAASVAPRMAASSRPPTRAAAASGSSRAAPWRASAASMAVDLAGKARHRRRRCRGPTHCVRAAEERRADGGSRGGVADAHLAEADEIWC